MPYLTHSFNPEEWEKQVWGLYQPHIPAWQKWLLRLLSPIFRRLVSNRLKVTREEADKSLANARNVLCEVETLLADGREFLLGTDIPTWIDFHLFSILAVMTNPAAYGGGRLLEKSRVVHTGGEALGPLVEEIGRLKTTPAGRFVDKVYDEFRICLLYTSPSPRD